MKKINAFIIFIILISLVIGIYFYSQLPEKMVTHWNVKGQVNGYMPKIYALSLFIILDVILLVLFILIPKIDTLLCCLNIQK